MKKTKLPSLEEVLTDNEIVRDALVGKPPDSELYDWLRGDILLLSYIKHALKKGKTPEEVAQFYGVTLEGINKFILKG